jgi:hypothetical protein
MSFVDVRMLERMVAVAEASEIAELGLPAESPVAVVIDLTA